MRPPALVEPTLNAGCPNFHIGDVCAVSRDSNSRWRPGSEIVCPCARMIAFGAVDGEHAYVKNGWNCFDGFVVMSIWMLTIVSAFTSINSSVAFILTAFRAFRSFRFFEGTRQIIQTFVKARETLGLVTALMLVFFVMFAVIGREIFAGALTRSCRPFLDEIPIWTNASLVGLNATAMNCGDSSAGSHRRQLGGGATKGDLREIYGAEGEIAESFWVRACPQARSSMFLTGV